jgi:hypothetical protein
VTAILSAFNGLAGTLTVLPSGDTTGVKDAANINTALAKAGLTGGVVQLQPGGQYTVNAPIKWTAVTSVGTTQPDGLAPSLVGSPARPGTSHDIGPLGNTLITAASTFPSGEFMIDYVAATTTANVGFTVEGLMLACAGKAAGVRGCNQIQATWRNVVIDNTATPSPANNFGSPTGGMSFVASPSTNAYNNYAIDCYVAYPGQDGFYFFEGSGSWVVATRCVALNAARYGFVLGDNTNATDCREQGSATASFYVYGATMTGCTSGDVVPGAGNSILFNGSNSRSARVIGCRFNGSNTAGTDAATAMMQVINAVAVHTIVQGCTFVSGTHTSAWLYVNGSVSGQMLFSGTEFATTALGGSALTNAPTILFGTPTYKFADCPGMNPFGTLTVAVPATTVATGTNQCDATFYVTGAAGGSCTIAVSGGPTVTVPASTLVPVHVPAGSTVTPTFGAGNAPTWAVEGH